MHFTIYQNRTLIKFTNQKVRFVLEKKAYYGTSNTAVKSILQTKQCISIDG